ncbi:MAG: prolipoprotein diacylglyceryl transferase [Lachnospiraceae bacterium]|nr:prolipoprotein diacylglyceryl transferase [Lachnospiraceae bacterium]
MDTRINFPNLGIYLKHVGKSIYIGKFPIAFYGICISIAIIAGVVIAMKEAKRTGQSDEFYADLALYEIILSILGARAYYVIFEWDYYKDNIKEIINIRNGGLAIYGAVITAIIVAFVFAKFKKYSFPLITDTAGLGLVMGQIIGRWGNFFNREAFGGYTNNLLAMQLPVSMVRQGEITEAMWEHVAVIDGAQFISVHPTFLYEGMWNLLVFALMMLYRDKKAFNGEVFLIYTAGYGIGRFFIEALRTDQLTIGNTGIAISRVVGMTMFVVSIIIDITVRILIKNGKIKGVKDTKVS